MSYFKETNNNKKASSELDEVFSIFLRINDSSDHIIICDNIVMAIKEYHKITEFTEEYMGIFEQISDKLFKDPVVPNIGISEKEIPTNKDRDNKFKNKYRI